MTFGERLINTIFGLVNDVHYRTIMIPKQDTLMRKYFGNDLPSIDEIIRNVSLVFINHHFSLAYPRPYVSNMIEIGGIHVDPPKPLPKASSFHTSKKICNFSSVFLFHFFPNF